MLKNIFFNYTFVLVVAYVSSIEFMFGFMLVTGVVLGQLTMKINRKKGVKKNDQTLPNVEKVESHV